ncbi:MAG: hemolysin family protein [Bacillales bacterium]|nr:hemolysin family protein [Bacillales bacterium]MDY5920422.1 hemolysin family protein [Candidatus Enteromonas sp.]
MEIPIPVAIILAVLCLIGSAFFSATETAFACLNKYKFQVEAEDGKKASSFVVWFYEHFDTTLITVLIGNNAVAVGISSIATILFIQLLHAYIDNTTISMISSIVVAILTFLFGDTLPKLIAKKVPNAIARFSVYPILVFCILFLPVTLIFRGLTFLVRKVFRSKPEPEVQTEDIAEEIERMEKYGDLEANESDILVNSLDFADTSVKEVLTPLRRMKMLDTDGLDTPTLLEYIKKCPYSRIPLYYKEQNHIVGVLVVKNYLAAYFRDPKVSYLPYVQKAYFVTPAIKIDDLLDGFREHHTQIALVRKDGKILGLVTAEDALEELVGKIDEDGNIEAEAAQ